MISGEDTTLDWQRHTVDICVLPIGAFEQHAAHMPLTTDTIAANYFAKMISEGLDAALLAPLSYGTSLEHTGFRGSVSLHPETLMHVVRDIADEMERQAFRILIIVNGHGGNFPLVPASRYVNRSDRPIKIIIVNPWEYADPDHVKSLRSTTNEFHAGEWETSVFMNIAPELVGDDRRDMEPLPGSAYPLRQPELTHFCMGQFAPEGAVGFPSRASRELGAEIIAAIRKNIIPYLQDRIARLRENPRYAGPGGMALRQMCPQDIPAGMRLKETAGWNQTEDDWSLFLEGEAKGCFAAVHNGFVIGTVTTIRYESELAWIGMMLVDPDFRRMGISSRLMRRAIESLEDCPTIKLDATPEGEEVYAKLGFNPEFGLQRIATGSLLPSPDAPSPATPLGPEDLDDLAAFDRQAFGADRRDLLTSFMERSPEGAWKLLRDGKICAYCVGRPGTRYYHLGPVVADNLDDAAAVADRALSPRTGEPVVIDVPDPQEQMTTWLAARGFSSQRPFIRMCRGPASAAERPDLVYAIAGPEWG